LPGDTCNVNLRETRSRRRVINLLSVRRKTRGRVQRSFLIIKRQDTTRNSIYHHYSRRSISVSRECDPRTVRRNRGIERSRRFGPEMSKRLLIASVPVHSPDFVRAGPVGDEIDSAPQQRSAAAELLNDVVGESVRSFHRAFLAQVLRVSLPQELGRLRVRLPRIV